jgi:predicted ATPase
LIHRAGPRGDRPFVDVNCAAIPAGLLEAELFGFERGAFTDARQPKAGLFQSAHGGTILLDEVALLSDALQAKLLNIIEERRVRRLGSTRSEPVDLSIIAATNEDLLAAVHARRFREDLYHRLAVVTLRLPSLRERREDIPILAEHFLARACHDYGLPPKRLTSGARDALCAHKWPGNVRELANVMERVALLVETSHVDSETLGLLGGAARSREAPAPATPGPALDAQVESLERQQLLQALEETRWNVVRAAARLGITRAMIRHRMLKYDLVPPSRRDRRRPPPAAPPPPPVEHPVALPPGTPRWESRLVALVIAILHPTDEARTRAELGRDFGLVVQKVESFAGRIEDAGPSRIVAAFGVEPTEDAARRAALAALAIQNALARRLHSEGRPALARIAIHADQCPVDVAQELMTLQAAEFLYESTGFPEVEYSFKHALTHEVTYHSLAVESRRAFHARIVEALEHLYRERLGEQMEVLAHHAVRGEVWEKAVTYLREAGVKAFMRSANVDALAYFTRGLEVVQFLDEASRDRHELALLLALGPAIQATKGLGAPEAERVFGRARELSERCDEPAAAFQALWGQWMVAAGLSRIEAARRIGRELVNVAERASDRALELEAHHAMWATSFWLGELAAVRQHAEQGMLLYDPNQHRSLAFLYGGHDPGVCSRWFAAWNFWLLGHPGRARDACHAAIALAERLAHPPTIAIALTWACGLSHFERDTAATERYARRLIHLAKDENLPAWGAAGAIFHGWAIAEAGAGGAGIPEIREGLVAAHTAGTLMPIAPLYKLVLADACLKYGSADEGLRLIDETLAGMALTGERVWHGEFHRLKGELLLVRSSLNHEAAETCFRQALEIARAQDARAWELRAATSLGRLLARHDRGDHARRMLGELYSWFTEPLVDTADLRDAKRLIDEIDTAGTRFSRKPIARNESS